MSRKKNPLNRRIIKEFTGEWTKYLVIFVILVLMIGVVSGVYISNTGMIESIKNANISKNLEDGNFTLKEKADSETIRAIESGEKADIKTYLKDKAKKEADDEILDKVNEEIEKKAKEQIKTQVTSKASQIPGITDAKIDEMVQKETDKNLDKILKETYKSDDYKQAVEDAKKEAYEEIDKEVNDKYDKLAEDFKLNEEFTKHSVKVYENFYKEAEEINSSDNESSTVRLYKINNNPCNEYNILEGQAPQNSNEIMIDKSHAKSADIKLNDTITVSGKEFKVTGLINLVNYTALLKDNADILPNITTFDIALVNEEAFDLIDVNEVYNYAFIYDKKPSADDKKEQAAYSENFMKCLMTQTTVHDGEIKNYMPAYLNSSISYAPNDLGSDKQLFVVFLYLIMIILSFIIAITVNNTIIQEASVIGTLRASGYTKGELLRHYMAAPVITVIAAAVFGNIAGYILFSKVFVNMYSAAYSLGKAVILFNSEAFLMTTVIPVLLAVIIIICMISYRLKLSPNRFLHHDFKTNKRKKAMKLPNWKFMKRFRLRIFFQNIPSYIMLFFGILFSMTILEFAIGMESALQAYQTSSEKSVFCNYETILTSYKDSDDEIIETDTSNAEKFLTQSLIYKPFDFEEEISVYGVEKNSRYINLSGYDFNENDVLISSSFAKKYGLETGDKIKLEEKFNNHTYELNVKDIYDYDFSLCIFMPENEYKKVFDLKEDEFSGYLSDNEIKDIDEEYIASVLTKDSFNDISKLLDSGMGQGIKICLVIAIIIAVVVMYLLTKIIIEKNENSIALTKILGYKNSEISGLYIITTAAAVIIFAVISSFVSYLIIKQICSAMFLSMSGYLDIIINFKDYVEMILLIVLSYEIVTFADYRRIKKIDMRNALKNVE